MIKRQVLVPAALALAAMSASCGGGGKTTNTTGGGALASVTSSATGSSSATAGATGSVAHDCSALGTTAISAALGGSAKLEDRSSYSDVTHELTCYYMSNSEPNELYFTLGGADSYINFQASQEGTGIKESQPVEGFDAALAYGDDILIARRGGFAVWLNAYHVYPQVSRQQLVAIAQEVTASA